MRILRLLSLSVAAAAVATVSYAQPPVVANSHAAGTNLSAGAQDPSDPDLDPNPVQPDFTLASLPTTLRLPVHKLSFRLTHRFLRPLGAGDFGDLAGDLFGLDSGAAIGLEFRYGLIKGGQIGVYRTSIDKTVQFFAQYDLRSQKQSPVGLSVVANVDGTNNFQDSYSPGISLVLSREIGEHAALYVEPAWVNNTNPQPKELVDDNDTVVIGLGGRVRVRKNTFLFLEGSPRISGYRPGDAAISFGIEQRVGGHLFQLNFSNAYSTTLAQVARGASTANDWYFGFNLSRKFY